MELIRRQRRRFRHQTNHQFRLRQASAPTFSPDGKKILFASNKNKCDSNDFELFLINVDGTGLEQVTDYGVFTSFPEFSPDSSKIVFASSYKSTSRYEFNIFTADWKP